MASHPRRLACAARPAVVAAARQRLGTRSPWAAGTTVPVARTPGSTRRDCGQWPFDVLPQPRTAFAVNGAASRRFATAAGATGDGDVAAALNAILCPSRVNDVVNPRLVGSDGAGGASWVSDVGRRLNDAEREDVDRACEDLSRAWRLEVAVVVLDALPADVLPSGFAAALLNYWGVGDARLHTGVVVLLLLRQRRLEVRVGYGAERVLGPEVMKSIQAEHMVHFLRAGAVGSALANGVRGVYKTLEASGPPQWRRPDSGVGSDPERNRHGFGGGQTPVDEFKQQ